MDPTRIRSPSSTSLGRSASPPVPSSLRRPLSSDDLANDHQPKPRPLRHSSSNSSLKSSTSPSRVLTSRRSSGNLRKPVATRDWTEPTLEQLMRQEEEAARARPPLPVASTSQLTPARSVPASASALPNLSTHSPSRPSHAHPIRPSFARTRSARSTSGASTSGLPRIEVDGANGEWTRFAAGLRSRRGSWGEHNGVGGGEEDDLPEPESAVLFPPHYGRPGPSPSPDIFA